MGTLELSDYGPRLGSFIGEEFARALERVNRTLTTLALPGCALGDDGGECRYYGVNPVAGSVSFDSIGLALMTIFQCVTLEGWTPITYQLEDASGSALAPLPSRSPYSARRCTACCHTRRLARRRSSERR